MRSVALLAIVLAAPLLVSCIDLSRPVAGRDGRSGDGTIPDGKASDASVSSETSGHDLCVDPSLPDAGSAELLLGVKAVVTLGGDQGDRGNALLVTDTNVYVTGHWRKTLPPSLEPISSSIFLAPVTREASGLLFGGDQDWMHFASQAPEPDPATAAYYDVAGTGLGVHGSKLFLVGTFYGKNVVIGQSTLSADLDIAPPFSPFVAALEPARASFSGQALAVIPPNTTTTGNGRGNSVAVDEGGNIYVTGDFSGVLPAPGGSKCTALTSRGDSEGFLVKYNSALECQWAIQMGGSGLTGGVGYENGRALAYDKGSCSRPRGIYVTGRFVGANFSVKGGPNGDAACLRTLTGSAEKVYVARLNPDTGRCERAWAFGSTGMWGAFANALAVDSAGDVYVAGQFEKRIYIDNTDNGAPDGTYYNAHDDSQSTSCHAGNLDCEHARDMFVAKLTAPYAETGSQWDWFRRIGGEGGPQEEAFGLAVGQDRNIYLAGTSRGTKVTIGPTTNTLKEVAGIVSNTIGNDVFVAVFNPAGTPLFAQTYGGAGDDEGRGIAVDGSDVYVTGSFMGTASFGGVNLPSSNGVSDGFLLHLSR